MSIVEDFLFLAWGETNFSQDIEAQKRVFKQCETIKREELAEFFAIILTCNKDNIKNFKQIPTFSVALKALDAQENCVEKVQIAIVNFLEKSELHVVNDTLSGIKKLQQGGVVQTKFYKQVEKLLPKRKPLQANSFNEEQISQSAPTSYKEFLSYFDKTLEKLHDVIEASHLKNELHELKEKLHNTSFSIGITGVINAGKSTMLNALLGKEVLGTSVVPETANLTIIKYAKNPYAKVNYWTKSEWERIEKSAKQSPSIELFVKQTKEQFEKLDGFITKEGKSQEVSLDGLAKFTSAKESNSLCNLIKSVELYTDLKFVQDGVHIVDTPGLDDPVVQREEITKEYLSRCDVLVHLMNAKQSATKKDVDFIIDTLMYANVGRLLVVITRIDAISKEELDEVIAYTKSSIKQQLHAANKEASFDSIIQKIDFLPIAGKMALLHRVGKEDEALKAGYSLEKSGILEIENYLEAILFGKNSEKSTVLMANAKSKMVSTCKESLEDFTVQANNLQKSAKELQDEYEQKRQENKQNHIEISTIHKSLVASKEELEEYFSTLENFLKMRFEKLKGVATERVYSDVSYELRKNSKKPSSKRIETIVNVTIKDGLVDMARDYKHEFNKKLESEMVKLSTTSSLFEKIQGGQKLFDAKEFFDTNFGGILLSGNYEIYYGRIHEVIKFAKKKEIEALNGKLNAIFYELTQDILGRFLEKTKILNGVLIEDFLHFAKEPVEHYEKRLLEEESVLLAQVKLLQRGEEEAKKRLGTLLGKISWLENFLQSEKL